MDERVSACYAVGLEVFSLAEFMEAVRKGEVGLNGELPTDGFYCRVVLVGAIHLGDQEVQEHFS